MMKRAVFPSLLCALLLCTASVSAEPSEIPDDALVTYGYGGAVPSYCPAYGRVPHSCGSPGEGRGYPSPRAHSPRAGSISPGSPPYPQSRKLSYEIPAEEGGDRYPLPGHLAPAGPLASAGEALGRGMEHREAVLIGEAGDPKQHCDRDPCTLRGTENSQPVFPGSSPIDPEGSLHKGSLWCSPGLVHGLPGLLQSRCLPRPPPLPRVYP